MENYINIGNKIEKSACDSIADFIDKVFSSGRINGMDQATIIKALELFDSVIAQTNTPEISISDCEFYNTTKESEEF